MNCRITSELVSLIRLGADTSLGLNAGTVHTAQATVGFADRVNALVQGHKSLKATALLWRRAGTVHTVELATGTAQVDAVGYVTLMTATRLWRYTVSMLTRGIADGHTRALLGSHVTRIAVTFLRLQAAAVRCTLIRADRITLARLLRRPVAQPTFALIGRFLAELIGTTARTTHWYTGSARIGIALKVLLAFACIRCRAVLVCPLALSATYGRTVAILGCISISIVAYALIRSETMSVRSTSAVAGRLAVICGSLVAMTTIIHYFYAMLE